MNTKFDQNKITPTQLAPRLYCFVSTRSESLIARLRARHDEVVEYTELDSPADHKRFLFVTPRRESGKLIASAIINDQGDYDLGRMVDQLLAGAPVHDPDSDSLVSLACNDADAFACSAGFWGITTHYWHFDADTFVCSNNVFLTAGLVGDELSETGMYEYLFFNWQRRDHTWFKGIQSLLPGQQLKIDLRQHNLQLAGGTDFNTLLEPQRRDLVPTVRDFFVKAKERIGDEKTKYISLSSGSDSRTVLSCMRNLDMKPHAISFGNFNMLETRAVSQLSNQLNVPWLFVDLAGFHESYGELFTDGSFYSNGLINPLRVHYVWLYSHLRRGNALFEGIFGSEFIKGEIAMPAMASDLYRDVVMKGQTVAGAIDRYYPQLDAATRRNMAAYIETEYGYMMVDVNTPEGARQFQRYLLEDVPRRVFAGVIQIAFQNNMMTYYPFLSPKILQAVFSNGSGMRNSFSLRKDFVGPIASLRAEALVVKEMDEEIYNSLLDRNVRFRDVLIPHAIADTRRRMRVLEKRLTIGNLFGGQIDNTRVVESLRAPAISVACPGFPEGLANDAGNDLLAKTAVTYRKIQDLARTFRK